MQCKFLTNGITLDLNRVLKPCCTFQPGKEYREKFNVANTSIEQWQSSDELQRLKTQLDNNEWPAECVRCEKIESAGRRDSVRLNGESAYSTLADGEYVLEIRPGNVCNFACQTCWPRASSRVQNFYRKANIDFIASDSSAIDYEILNPIKNKIKHVAVLGGEPFYDPQCKKFFSWMETNRVKANYIIFTNGSELDRSFLQSTDNIITLVFSLDAVGRPAEYIRFGTQWQKVLDNFNFAKTLPNVNVRVNVTQSPYNYFYFPDLIEWLCEDWPEVVTFGIAYISEHFTNNRVAAGVFPLSQRSQMIKRLQKCVSVLRTSEIPKDQKSNAVNAVLDVVKELETLPYDQQQHREFVEFVQKLDTVKNIKIDDYCPELAACLDINL